MSSRASLATLLLTALLLAPASLLSEPIVDENFSVAGDGVPQLDTASPEVRLISPDPNSIRNLQPVGLESGITYDRLPEAWTRIGTIDVNGWQFTTQLPKQFAASRTDLSMVIVDGEVDLWQARQQLEEMVVIRAHIPPSGFLVQGSMVARSNLATVDSVLAIHSVPIGLMVESELLDLAVAEINSVDLDDGGNATSGLAGVDRSGTGSEGGEQEVVEEGEHEDSEGGESEVGEQGQSIRYIEVQATGWRDFNGTPQDHFAAPGLIGDMSQEIVRFGVEPRRVDVGRHETKISLEDLASLASSPSLAWLAAPPDWQLHNNVARGHMRVSETTGAFITGLNGSGQKVAVADSGIDQDHGDMNGRIFKVESMTFNDPSTEDTTSGHGTHVACTVLGDGSRGGYAGVAPEADLYFQAMENDNTGQFSGASMDYMLRTAYSEGALIHTNSWGAAANHNEYTTGSEDVDSRTSRYDQFWSYDGQTVLFSAGNDGTTGLSPPATAKNSIAVANHHNRGGSAPDTLAQSSSRGPVDDGRIKPDISAPGSWVRSCKSQDASETGTATWTSTWYLEYSGTSMAAPNAAGASILIREYLMEVAGRPAPQGALIKSLLILGAEDMGPRDIPNSNEGWGRINLANSLVPGTDVGVFVDDRHSLRSGQQMSYSFNVTRAWSPFKAVLSWSDYEGSTWATKQLQNDLDLELTAPDGTVYLGNDFQNGRSATGGSRDDINNVEVVLVDSAQLGVWTLKVKDTSHGGARSDQPFALAVRGVNVNDLRPDPIVVTSSFALSSEIPQVGEMVTLTVPIANQGSGRANDLVISASIDGTSLPSETIYLGPGETRYIDWDWTPVNDGTKTLLITVDPSDAIEESDETNNVVTIDIDVSAPGVRMDTNETVILLTDATSSTTQWVFRLKNTALIPTNASITANKPIQLSDGVEQDWFSSFGQTSFELNGSGEVWFQYTLVHPSPPQPGLYRVDIIARDTDNSIDFPLSVHLNVPILPDIRFTRPFTTSLPVSPVENRSFSVTVHNDGNGAQGYDLELQAPDGWSLGLYSLGTTLGAARGSSGSIEQAGSREVAMTVVPPTDMVAAGTELAARLLVRSQADETKSWGLDLPLVVAEYDALNVGLQTNLGVLSPDARVSLMFEIENLGNHNIAATPSVVLPGGWALIGTPPNLDLPVGQTSYWRITLQGNGQAEGGNLSVHFETAAGVIIDHELTLNVTSPISASLAFNRIILGNGSTATNPLGAGDHETGPPGFVLEWTIANQGTVSWEPSVVLRTPSGSWFTDCQSPGVLEGGDFGSFICSVIVPNDVPPSSEPELTIEVDAGGIALTDTISLRIAEQRQVSFTVINTENLVVGKPSTIQVEVTNAGNIRLEHRVEVEILDGWSARILDTETVDLQQDETRSLDIEITPTNVGEALVRVSLMGDGDSVAFEHSFTLNATSESSEGTAGGFTTTVIFGVVLLLIVAAAVGIIVLLQRERQDKSSQRIPTTGLGPGPSVVGGFEAILGGLPAPPSSTSQTTARVPVPTDPAEVATVSAQSTVAPLPSQPAAEIKSRDAVVTAQGAVPTSAAIAPIVAPTAASSAPVAPLTLEAPTATPAPQHESESTSEPKPSDGSVTPVTPTATTAASAATAAAPIMCWACAKPIDASTSRGCPECGARYHPLGTEACAHAEVPACRNCGVDSATFVSTTE